MEPNLLTIAEASRLIAKGDLSPVDLLEACIARLEAVDETLHSFVTPTVERAREEARRAEAEIARSGPRGPLHGIPYGLKDIFETAGVRTTAQSRSLADYVPTRDCDAKERLSAAGAVLLGKTATWELAHGGPSWDVLFPPACNPWDRNCHPAGSSTGSAVAVAAGICPAALGTDTGGSVRGPSGVCGIAGLKPTYGRVSRRGVIPNSFTQDHCGPLAWTAEDVAIVLQAIAGHDGDDPGSAPVPVPDYRASLVHPVDGLRIGVPYRWIEEEAPASAAARAALDAALAKFAAMGAQVRPVELPPLIDFEDVKKTIALAELFTIHQEVLRTRPDLLGHNLRYRILSGALVRAEDYIQALRLRTELARAVQSALDEIDLIMLPTAEPAGKLEPTPPSTLFTKLGWVAAFSISGNPALSVCSGFTDGGLPLSLQIVGRLFDEATVLRAGHAFEKATPWRERRPMLEAA